VDGFREFGITLNQFSLLFSFQDLPIVNSGLLVDEELRSVALVLLVDLFSLFQGALFLKILGVVDRFFL
jgi:hypothetical protein